MALRAAVTMGQPSDALPEVASPTTNAVPLKSADSFADDPHRQLEAAALADAIERLRGTISDERIDADLTVGQFVARTQSLGQLVKALQGAQQVGPPRWSGDVCEVRVRIDGAVVARALTGIAAEAGENSPRPAAALGAELSEWSQRAFTATGSSIGAAGAASALGESSGTAGDARAGRHIAYASARANAVTNVVERIDDVEFLPGVSVGQVMQDASVAAAVRSWLSGRPVTQVEFLIDGAVDVTIAVPGREFAERLCAAAKAGGRAVPQGADFDALASALGRRVSLAEGRGSANAAVRQPDGQIAPPTEPATGQSGGQPIEADTHGAVAASGTTMVGLPVWADRKIVCESLAMPAAGLSKLRIRSSAEDAAMQQLHREVDGLALPSGGTIAEAVRRDPLAATAVRRAMEHVQVEKVVYEVDGSVSVRILLDGADLWSALGEAGYR
jgi:hypothetical protein